jgi:hypothetical protein
MAGMPPPSQKFGRTPCLYMESKNSEMQRWVRLQGSGTHAEVNDKYIKWFGSYFGMGHKTGLHIDTTDRSREGNMYFYIEAIVMFRPVIRMRVQGIPILI